MESTADDTHFTVADLVNEPVLFVNTPRPEPRIVLFERLRFSDSLKRMTQHIGYEFIYFLERLFVLINPVRVILP